MLTIRNLEAYYGAIQALKGVSLHVLPEEVVCLIGANGAGKSTLLRAISGLVPVIKGEISLDGISLIGRPPEEIVSLGISYVPEGRQIFGPLTVLENLELGAYHRFRNLKRRELKREIEEIFQIFPELKERKSQPAGTLSGGEQQMLVIGRALMSRPKLLLLDEPSMGLAPIVVKKIFQIIRDLTKLGTTILLVEQNAKMAFSLANRGYILETGKIILEGETQELSQNREVKRAYLGKGKRGFLED